MQRRLDAKDNQLEIAKSEALAQQQVEVANTATNLLTVKLQADAEMAEFNRLREVAAAESRAQLEAQATAIDALRGSVSSTTQLMAERSNAVVGSAGRDGTKGSTAGGATDVKSATPLLPTVRRLRAVTGTDLHQ